MVNSAPGWADTLAKSAKLVYWLKCGPVTVLNTRVMENISG